MTLILVSVLISFVLTYFVRRLAIRKAILDIPNERSSHTVPTPRGGGLAIAVTWFGTLAYLFIAGKIEKGLFFALLPGLILSSVSLVDDLIQLSPKIRLVAQFLTAILGWFAVVYFTGLIDKGLLIVFIYSAIAIPSIIWFINLFNFMDGSDGILGMEGLFFFVGLYFITGAQINLLMSAAILGFLFWNWPKAKIFCGDVGSTLIGYNVALLAIYYYQAQEVSLLIPLMLSSLFWFDASLTLLRRFMNKEKLTQAHKKHAYQRLIQSGYSHFQVLILGIVLNLILFVLAYISFKNPILLNFLFAVHIVSIFIYIKYADKRKPFEL